ncbi:ABC transporter substrate-binding protein [Nostocaceae cyanobacterium CENA357]|uniref:ABC transporter substrate-binding protein n=1 Tax=Atlanticothrix silvestris CENA357 TaxID=1725252 RepID=A0A8J7L4Z6_9CYAN|nr:ABC transporter substrate-binding protein [Atlanticothrix silvestris]MBH8555519.1 ABC transporter substrate-binding protein [Atlanticothrix silvestris CENA357]
MSQLPSPDSNNSYNSPSSSESNIQQNAEDSAIKGGMQAAIGNDNNQNQTNSSSTGNVVNVNVGFHPHTQAPNTSPQELPNLPVEVAQTIRNNNDINNRGGIFPPLRMSRRAFIPTVLGTSLVTASGGWLAGQNHPRITWKMVSVLGDNTKNLILYKAPQMICDRIAQMTDGYFTIELDRTGNTEEILKKVSDGNIECGYSGVYYNSEKYRVLFFGCAIPFGLNPQEQNAWLYYKKDPKNQWTFMQEIYSKLDLNVIPFPAGATGAQMGGWFNKEIKSIADFDGITMRIPGLGAEVLQKFGVVSDKQLGFPIPIDQIADKVRDSTLNAAEWIGPYDDFQLGLHNVLPYYYYPGWWEPGTTYDVQVNTGVWKSLPEKYQEIFKAVCLETHIKILAEYDQKNSEKLQQLIESRSIKLRPFNDEILQEAKKQTDILLKLYADKNKLFGEVYTEWSKFKFMIKQWSKLNNI